MSDEIVFHHHPMSRGRIVHFLLEEVGAPYRIELRSFEKRDHKSAEYLAINPMGKVPAIEHRGTVVTEAAAICAYLADAFPAARARLQANVRAERGAQEEAEGIGPRE
jgi:glutathione S-transferase